MTNVKYANAYAEVYTILQYLEPKEYNKIPDNVISVIKDNRNTEHQIQVSADVEEMKAKMLTETKAILLNLYRDYLANPAQSKKIKQWQNEDRWALETVKKIKTNTDIFENKDKTEQAKEGSNSLVEVKQIPIWKKIMMKLKSFFSKKA